MANEISSIATIRALSPALNSRQVAKPELANLPEARGQELPTTGKDLPPRLEESVEIRDAVTRINKIVQNIQRDISFNMDEDSGRTIIRVIDSGSGELIRQIPSEEVLAIATLLRDVQENSVVWGELEHGLLFSDST